MIAMRSFEREENVARPWIFVSCVVLLWNCQSVPKRPTSAIVYQVKVEAGDTLSSIAAHFDTDWQAIQKENNFRPEDELKVGQIIKVRPGPGGMAAIPDDVKRKSKIQAKVFEKTFDKSIDEPAASGFPGSKTKPDWQEEDLIDDPQKPASRRDGGKANGASAKARLFGQNDAEVADLIWPASGNVSSQFGPRWGKWHNGIDIRASRGSPIRSVFRGRVIFSGRLNGYGKTIIVHHGKFRSLYGHCGTLKVKEGAWVETGTEIGKVGASGNAKGAHLHFEIRAKGDEPVDPLDFLPADLYSVAAGDVFSEKHG